MTQLQVFIIIYVLEKIMKKILEKTDKDSSPPEDQSIKSLQLRNLYETREGAEQALEQTYGRLILGILLKNDNYSKKLSSKTT